MSNSLLTPWTAACQAFLYITNLWSLLKLMSIELVMASNHLVLCHPLLLLPSIVPSIRVFSNESALCIRWPKYWIFSFSISPSNGYSGLIFFRLDRWISFQSKELSRGFSNTTVQKHQFLSVEPAGLCGRCTGVAVPLRVVPSPTGLPSKRGPGLGSFSRADRGIGVVRHVAPPTWLGSNFLVRPASS